VRPVEEKRAWDSVDRAIKNLERLRKLMLDVLARDDEAAASYSPAPDPVHKASRAMCRAIEDSASGAQRAVNLARRALQDVPTDDRAQTVPDCLACGGPAVPRPTHGYCGVCDQEWIANGRPDRAAFERSRR
jgi:hypothetical protein